MASVSCSTREKLLGLVDDIELISKEILENAVAPKAKKMSAQEHDELTILLIQKDKELKETVKLAGEQGEIEKKMQQLQEEVKKQDDCIRQLQKQLKDAETVLSTAIYQAKQKLECIEKAKEAPVSSEELIKYAHRISASNAVVAPLTWQQGDPRRPYPTDMEMRLGLLGRTDAAAAESSRSAAAAGRAAAAAAGVPQQAVGAAGASSDFGHHPSPHHSGIHHGPPLQASGSSPSKMHHGGGHFSWHGGEMSMTMRDGSSFPMDIGHGGMPTSSSSQQSKQQGQEDVEVMSTDSSSSSSTDSN